MLNRKQMSLIVGFESKEGTEANTTISVMDNSALTGEW